MRDRKVEKEAIVIIDKIKGHLIKTEGLLKGFRFNLKHAWYCNNTIMRCMTNLDNARAHDLWKTIGYSISGVAWVASKWF